MFYWIIEVRLSLNRFSSPLIEDKIFESMMTQNSLKLNNDDLFHLRNRQSRLYYTQQTTQHSRYKAASSDKNNDDYSSISGKFAKEK